MPALPSGASASNRVLMGELFSLLDWSFKSSLLNQLQLQGRTKWHELSSVLVSKLLFAGVQDACNKYSKNSMVWKRSSLIYLQWVKLSATSGLSFLSSHIYIVQFLSQKWINWLETLFTAAGKTDFECWWIHSNGLGILNWQNPWKPRFSVVPVESPFSCSLGS